MSDFDLDAAGLRADGADLATNVEVLASKLENALPNCRVVRRSKRLFGKDKVVEMIDVAVGNGHYTLGFRDGRVEAFRAARVRGVVIRREELELDAWIQQLGSELKEAALSSAEARTALERLVG